MTGRHSFGRLRQAFVSLVYADHNRSRIVRSTVARVLMEMPPDGVGLNVGSGQTRLDPRVRSLDIYPGPNIDCVGRAEAIPLADASVDLVLSQETLEHVRDPSGSMHEIYRILKPGGRLYLQLPFVIGYHPGPTDFWRFTKEGIRELVESADLECQEVGIAVGASTGFYRIAVEYLAILLSVPSAALYTPAKSRIRLLPLSHKAPGWADR